MIGALEAAGGEASARFVGGCVRNTILGRPINDIDIATQLEPAETMRALAAAGLRHVPTGLEHGTVTAFVEGRPFEVTTLRRDVATDGRRAVVAFTRDWAEDAERRDFRLNALYLDAQGRLYDPVGCGLADARAGRIIFVGDPEERIREDYLRILRFFRFFAWYGRGPADAAGLEACAMLRAGLAQLSAERVSKELLKLLAADDPREALGLMRDTGVLDAVLPDHAGLERLERLVEIDSDPELRLAALWRADPAAAVREADRLRLSKAQRERLASAVTASPEIGADLSPLLARRSIYRLGARAFADRVKLAWAGAPQTGPEPWRALLSEAETLDGAGFSPDRSGRRGPPASRRDRPWVRPCGRRRPGGSTRILGQGRPALIERLKG
ncbi:MAG: CCA tRNA nucleotidyltransferase [Caulobacteraceae bacterium]